MRRRARTVNNLATFICGAVVAVVPADCPAHGQDRPAVDEASQGVLHLANTGFMAGELRGSDNPNVLRWQSPLFTKPFDFKLDSIAGIHFPTQPDQPKPNGQFCVELLNGDALFGSPLRLTEGALEFSTDRFGRIQLRRDSIRRMFRSEGSDLIYVGPNGLAGWTETGTTKQWREEAGQIVTDKRGSTLFGDFGVPAEAVIEFEMSWSASPEFTLAFGVSENPKSLGRAGFEIWTGYLVAIRETDREVDTAIVQDVSSGAGRIYLVVYIDQIRGRMIVLNGSGVVADLQVTPKRAQAFGGIRLSNRGGGVRLERLHISRWDGVPPVAAEGDKPRLQRRDGSIVPGQLAAIDADAKQFKIRAGGEETAVPMDETASVYFGGSPVASSNGVRAIYHDGTRIGGKLTGTHEDRFDVVCPAIQEPIQLPASGIRSLLLLDRSNTAAAAGPHGKLTMDGLESLGELTDGDESDDASCLVWQPAGSDTSSPMRPGMSGLIDLRDLPKAPETSATSANVRQPVLVRDPVARVVNRPKELRRSLHLRTGDTIPCEVLGIDEDGISFKSALSEATFVSHDQIKAVELVYTSASISLNKSKLARLLTLPRMYSDSPFTHLIRSNSGDYLRGRILSLDQDTLRIEVQLEAKEIPRERVAQIIWLHPDELNESIATEPAATDSPETTRIQVLARDGNRLTFCPQQFREQTISGTSDVLGLCRANIAQLDQILIGSAIQKEGASDYQNWKLHHAVEPRFVKESNDESPNGRSLGADSPLVGKPAPEIDLPLLDGTRYRLSASKGRVVILDFWASWCGPCIQSMPIVEQVASEFKDQNVQLIAVNLEEPATQIAPTLERHNLQVTVALDRDGIVAQKYQATAIPQTVVIDRAGNVARLFVGGGPRLADQLREAVQAALAAGTNEPGSQ